MDIHKSLLSIFDNISFMGHCILKRERSKEFHYTFVFYVNKVTRAWVSIVFLILYTNAIHEASRKDRKPSF